jgi:rapamycin-insensitive companion of mTOR
MMEVDCARIPRIITRAIVAISGSKEDTFRRVCLDTLREMAVLNIAAVAQCNGIKTLFDAVLDPACEDVAESLVLTLMFLLNDAPKRRYVRPALDLYTLMATFTETDVVSQIDREKRWKASRKAIVTMLRSWTGILLLTSDTFGIRALIDLLRQEHDFEIQKMVLDTLCEVFYVPQLSASSGRSNSDGQGSPSPAMDYSSTGNGMARTRGGSSGTAIDAPAPKRAQPVPFTVRSTPNSEAMGGMSGVGAGQRGATAAAMAMAGELPHNLLDNYMAMVVVAFEHNGLIEGLTLMGMHSDKDLAALAIHLLSEVLQLACRLLPETMCQKMLAVPRLVKEASVSSRLSDRAQARQAHSMLTTIACAVGAGGKRPLVLSAGGGRRSVETTRQPVYANGVHLASSLLQGANRMITAWNGSVVHNGELPHRTRQHMLHGLKRSIDMQVDSDTVKDRILKTR